MDTAKEYTSGGLKRSLFKYITWSLINIGVLSWLRYLDNNFIIGETALSILLILPGLINAGVLVTGLSSLKKLSWKNCLYAFFAVVNFIIYVLITLNMYSQAGPIIND